MRTLCYGAIVCFLLLSFWISGISAQEETNTGATAATVYLPLVSANNSTSNTSTILALESEQAKTWLTYYSSELHITFAYPLGWQLEIPQNFGKVESPADLSYGYSLPEAGTYSVEGYVLGIQPPKDSDQELSKIEITVQGYEIEKGQSLIEWQKSMAELLKATNPEYNFQSSIKDVTEESLRHAKAPAEILHTVNIVEGYGPVNQTVWVSNGRIVYIINTNISTPAMEAVLKQLSASLQFDADSPQDLNELYNTSMQRPSLQWALDKAQQQETEVEACDIVCRDAKAYAALLVNPDLGVTSPPDPEFAETERMYYEKFEHQEDDTASSVEAASVAAVNVSSNRKALPPYWRAPVAVTSAVNVLCGSGAHTGPAEFALDISVGTGTNVYAANGGLLTASLYDTNTNPTSGTSYGNTMVIQSSVLTADETRTYYHRYAHLNDRIFQAGVTPGYGSLIAHSGSTGTGTPAQPHLHFHISTNNNPVDASPVFGFVPNLNYPSVSSTCGQIVPVSLAPIIIEPVAFTVRQQPRNNRSWFCYTGGHTNECYMHAVPNDGAWFEVTGTVNNPNSPRLAYSVNAPQTASYRIWVCGRGGSGNDDSLHIGRDDVITLGSARITGFSSNSWVWKSEKADGTAPFLAMSTGFQSVDVFMREDGMRINRIVLTPNTGSTAPNIRCGTY